VRWTLAGTGAQGGRIRQPTMRNLDITDTRAKPGIYVKSGLLSLAKDGEIFKLTGK
jgi:argininosuccinate synthase